MENYSDSPEKGEDKTRRYVDLDTGELIETNIKTDGPDDGVGSLCELVDLPHERARTTKTAYPFKWVALFLPAFERCSANLISRSGRGRYVFDPDLFR